MKKLLILALAAFAFTACDDNNGNGNGNGNGTGNGGDATRLVSKITSTITPEGGPTIEGEPMKFTYDDQNRLEKLEMPMGAIEIDGSRAAKPAAEGEYYENYTIEYGDGSVTITNESNYGDGEEVLTDTFELNAAGYAVTGTSSHGDVYELTYSNGFLQKASIEDGDEIWAANYTWTGGNITSIVTGWEGEGDDETLTITLSSTANNAKCNLDLNAFTLTDCYPNMAGALIGIFGKRVAKLPSQLVWNYFDGEEDVEETASYTYTTDSKGYLTGITVNDPEGDTTEIEIEYIDAK